MSKKLAVESKKRADADTQVALSIVEMEQNQEKAVRLDRENREKLIASVHEVLGRVQAATIMSKFGDISQLIWLKQIKESKIYRDVPHIGTWEKFCNYLGKSRRMVDEQLQNLNVLGEDFLATCRQFSLGYRDIRKLRYAASDGDMVIDGECVVIGEDRIPLTPDNSEDLEAAVEALLESRDRKITDQNLKLKAKDRVLEEKERVIQKQEKDLAKYKKEVKARGFEPGEEKFIQEMENIKNIIVGLELKMDSRNMPEDPTPLMKAAYVETLGHAARVFRAFYDEAVDLFGDPEMDDDWQFPTSMGYGSDSTADDQARGPEDCVACEHRKAMSNPKKGMRIPGQHGKCTRADGLCFQEKETTGS